MPLVGKISLRHPLHFFTLFSLFVYSEFSLANRRIPDFETTRLKSTGGAGVASLLMDEATLLNPAPLAFFQNGSLYFQKSHANLESPPGNNQTFFIASDAKGKLNGSISYMQQNHSFHKRKRFSLALAYPTGKQSALGISYRHTREVLHDSSTRAVQKSTYRQIVLGVEHALSTAFTLGAVLIDPFQERPSETKALIGGQYVYQDFIALILDIGANYHRNLTETALWRAAIQIKLFSDLYLRTGVFNDRGLQEKGTGIGLGWVGPKLVVNLALKNTNLITFSEKMRETSFALSYKF